MADGSALNHLEEALLKHITGVTAYSPASEFYLALGTSPPADSSGTSWSSELSGNGYQRKRVVFRPATTDSECVSTVRNDGPIFFDQATANWSQFQYIAIWTAATGGTMLCWSEYAETVSGAPPVEVLQGQRLIIWDGDMEIELGPSTVDHFIGLVQWSKYLQEKLLNFVLAGGSFPLPSTYLALCFSPPDCEDTGDELDEVSGGSYVRAAIPWVNPVQDMASNFAYSESDPSTDIQFVTPTGYWHHPRWLVITDAASSGNVFCWQEVGNEPADPIYAGDDVTVDEVKVWLN